MTFDRYGDKAIELVMEGKSLFITGKAGTGKTQLLKEIVSRLEAKKRYVAVTAPTGIAAHNADGVTIHSFIHLPLSPYLPGVKIPRLYDLNEDEVRVVRQLQVLIIDEVSMVRCDMMDAADDILRHYRNSKEPFGGVQVVMFGDLFQLMPVADEEEEEQLMEYYESLYFIGSKVMEELDYAMLELKKIYRQDKRSFVRLLNKIRWGRINAVTQEKLDRLFHRNYKVSEDSHQIILTTHNRKSKRINRQKLEAMEGQEWDYQAYTEGSFPSQEYPTNFHLNLKVGARVMFLRNSDEYFNGMLGTVVALDDESIEVKADENGRIIHVKRSTWDFNRYHLNTKTKELEVERVATFKQYPLKLAWAITIHKSQGLTFDEVVIDAGKAFAAGQVYVALSRCRRLDKIVLMSRITPKAVMMDQSVRGYLNTVKRVEVEDEEVPAPKEERKSIKLSGTVKKTLTAYQKGCSPEEIAKRRGITLGTIYDHLTQLIAAGEISVYNLISKEDVALVASARKKADSDRLSLIKVYLPPEMTYETIKLAMAHILQE